MRISRIFLWLSAGLTACAVAVFIPLAVWLKWSPNDLSGRALVIVAESNGILGDADIKFYKENKGVADFFLMLFLGVRWSQLQSEDFLRTLDETADKGLSDFLGQMANGYGKLVKLTGPSATSDNLARTIKDLDAQGYRTDLILFVHGNTEGIYLHSETATPARVTEMAEKTKLGYVYQINCYGETLLDAWAKAGAKAAFGTGGVNAINIFAPTIFLRSFIWGDTFEKAVNKGYETEIKIWEQISRVIEGIFWLNPESLEASRPIIAGDKDYTFSD